MDGTDMNRHKLVTLGVVLLMIGMSVFSNLQLNQHTRNQPIQVADSPIHFAERSVNWSVDPSYGSQEGGTDVTISGIGFTSLIDDAINSTVSNNTVRPWSDIDIDDDGVVRIGFISGDHHWADFDFVLAIHPFLYSS